MKDTFYFSHDYNSRTDDKIKRLIRTHGMVGYGIFWAIIEDLYQNSNEMSLDYDVISYDLRTDVNIIKSIIEDFELFILNDKVFGSKSIEDRLIKRDEKSKKASDNARKRWGENDKRTKAKECLFYVIKLSNNEEKFIKCGITTESISRRYSGKTSNYEYEVVYQKEVDVNKGIVLENEINNKITKHIPKNQFGGYLECYQYAELSEILKIAMQNECNSIAKNINSNAIKERKGKDIKEIKERSNIFIKPSVPEIKEYCLERKNGIDVEKFFNFYEAKGWLIGSNKMKDWKACVRTWENKKTDSNLSLTQQLKLRKDERLKNGNEGKS